jgi:XTP/dITP diphosphohydrolase
MSSGVAMSNRVVMPSTYLYGTSNRGKLREVQALAARFAISIEGVTECNWSELGEPPRVRELSGQYEGNAVHKARAYAIWSGRMCLADDTGIEIEELGGYPGVFSARVGLKALQARLLTGRSYPARFVCCLAYAEPSGRCVTVTAELPGAFLCTRRHTVSSEGLDFSPYFVPQGESKALDVLLQEGFCDSHRARAMKLLLQALGKRGKTR